jgi:hypothetical protein
MPSILRSRLALFAMLGAFLIPISSSSLRGLTHVLVCEEKVRQPFTMIVPKNGEPELLSSLRITRADQKGEICGGLSIEPRARGNGPGAIEFILPVSNQTDHLWRGTISLQLGDTRVPVDIGEVGPGETVSDTVLLTLDEGRHEIEGSLLIGP